MEFHLRQQSTAKFKFHVTTMILIFRCRIEIGISNATIQNENASDRIFIVA